MKKWSEFILNKLRLLLFPFSVLFFVYNKLRFFLYKTNIYKSKKYQSKILSVGNIRIGGTGKTPFIDFLLQKVFFNSPIAVISKGYKRKQNGLIQIHPGMTASQVGDEAFLLFSKHPDVKHFVAKNRTQAIQSIEKNFPEIQTIILDDTYHHLEIHLNSNILLMDYDNPLYKDFLLPTGNLREPLSALNRADIVIVSKCPSDLNLPTAIQMQHKLNLSVRQSVFFSSFTYQPLQHLFKNQFLEIGEHFNQEVITFHGIAQPHYFLQYFKNKFTIIYDFDFPDHHQYSIKNIQQLLAIFNQHPQSIIVTTEKDATKLLEFKHLIHFLPIFTLPIKMKILFNQENICINKIKKLIV